MAPPSTGCWEELEGWWVELARGRWVPACPSHPAPCAHRVPSSRGAPQTVRGPDGPAAWRVRNLNHLWGRLRDFYQVRGRGGEAEPQTRGKARLPPPVPSAPRRSCSCWSCRHPQTSRRWLLTPSQVLSPTTPSCLYPLPPPLTFCGLCPAEEAVEELEGILRLLLGASVQVSGGGEGKGGFSFGRRGGRDTWCQHFHSVCLQCEHRELFIRHIQGLSLEVQSDLAAAIQEVLGLVHSLGLALPPGGTLPLHFLC